MALLADASSASLHPFVTGHVEPGATVITDAWMGYYGLAGLGYAHQRRSQRAARARGDDPGELLPAVHRIASLARRWLLSTHQGSVDEAHLQSYLDEFVFRFNRRRARSRGLVFYRLLQLAAGHDPVRYRNIVAGKRPRKIPPAPPAGRGHPPPAATASISASSACLASASTNEARTPLAARSANCERLSPSTEAARRYSSVSVVPNIGGSSLFSVTNRPSASSRGSGCAARLATWRVQTLDVGHTSSGTWLSRSRATSEGSSRQLMPCPIRSARSPSSASQIVAGPDISPACGTLCSPAAMAEANTERNASAKAGRDCSIPASPNPVSASGGQDSACSRVAYAAGPPYSPAMSKT